MIKALITHKILESCINAFFTNIMDNFNNVEIPLFDFFTDRGINPYLDKGIWKAIYDNAETNQKFIYELTSDGYWSCNEIIQYNKVVESDTLINPYIDK